MKTSLIIFGVIFLVIGGLLYFVPMQVVKADTTTIGSGSINSQTSFASITIPQGWAYASALIGFIFVVLGFTIPNPTIKQDSKKDSKDSFDSVIESKENIEIGDGKKRKIVKERTEKHRTVKANADSD